jgi:hypothetical protein
MAMTTLHVAVLRQDMEIVETIDIVLQDKEKSQKLIYIDQLDELGNTALSYAISTASTSIVHTLVRAGAEVNRRDRLGFTPLMDACYRGDERVISCLIDYGADVAMRNNCDVSALECIMMGESERKVEILRRLASFANRPQLNKSLSYAFNSSKEFCLILVQCGADPEHVGLLNKESKKPTDVIERRVRLQDEKEPVGVPVAWYNSNPMKNHQRRIYQIGQSGHYEIGKAKEWGLSELENLPEVSGSKETILDIPLKSSVAQYQYNFNNIEKVVAVVAPYSKSSSHGSQSREPLTRPTYVLVKWKDILPEHLQHCSIMADCESFILKSKFLCAVPKRNRAAWRDWIEDFCCQNENG